MGVSFSSISMINIFGDTISESSGDVTRNGNVLNMGANSWVKYVKEYSSDGDLITTDQAQVEAVVSISDNSLTSRYNCNVKVKLVVHYYETSADSNGQTVYSAGPSDIFLLTPYYDSETDGYLSRSTFDFKNSPISRLELYIYNTNSVSVSIGNIAIYNSLSIDEAIGGAVGVDCTFQNVTWVADGFGLFFTNGAIGCQLLENDKGDLAGINVDNKFVITVEENLSITLKDLLG